MSPDIQLAEAAFAALVYFVAMDRKNAAIHCSPVRYSPITFRLAEALAQVDGWEVTETVVDVLAHTGKYAEDPGR
jgi:hypothetical protein